MSLITDKYNWKLGDFSTYLLNQFKYVIFSGPGINFDKVFQPQKRVVRGMLERRV